MNYTPLELMVLATIQTLIFAVIDPIWQSEYAVLSKLTGWADSQSEQQTPKREGSLARFRIWETASPDNKFLAVSLVRSTLLLLRKLFLSKINQGFLYISARQTSVRLS
jgi:hypothetical protein